MVHNVGSADRVARVVLGVAVMAAGVYFKAWWGVLGLLPLLTAGMSWCPAYQVLGLSTCPRKTTPKGA